MRICKIDGCENKHHSFGYCHKHSQRYVRNGDPLKVLRTHENHKMTHSREYITWRSMKSRCNNPEHEYYKYYGGKGIKVCPEWQNNFNTFYKDMGNIPNGKELDRIKNDKDYSKKNCHWITHTENVRKRDCIRMNISYARKIRELASSGIFKPKDLATIYKVSKNIVWNILSDKTWGEAV